MEKLLLPIYKFFNLFQYQSKVEFKKGLIGISKGPIIPLIILLGFLVMTGVIVMRYIDLEIWRHDSFQFTPESSWYAGNFQYEGRWINYFLFDVLKPIPGHVAAMANLTILFYFGFLITKGVISDVISRLIFALSFLMIPVFHAQNMWPNITFGAMVFLPVVYYISKKLPPFFVFAIAAIYYFGTLSNFYFLVPLVYLESMKNTITGDLKKDFIYFFTKIVIPFALCFIVGFLVANGIVMANTGESISVGEWRKPSPANNFDQLLINLEGVHKRILGFGSKLFSTVSLVIWAFFSLFLLLSISRKTIWSIALLIMVFLSAFYTTVYHGILISDRTLCVSAISFVLFFCLIPALRFEANMLHLLLCVVFIFPFFIDSSNQLKVFAKITSYYRQQLEIVTKDLVPTENYEIVVFAEVSEIDNINKQIKKHFDLEFKWGERLRAVDRTIITPLRSLGYYKVFWMQDKKLIGDVKSQIQNTTRKDPFVLISLNNRPNSYGIVINNPEVDSLVLDEL